MLYCSWDMVQDNCNHFSFWAIFCPFTPRTAQKVKISKKKKKKKNSGDIIILPKCTKNHDHMLNCSWDMLCNSFFLPFYPPNSLKNQNLKTMKKPGVIIILHKCTKNHDHTLYCSWDMACDRCNYFSFRVIFYPFAPLTAQKSK